MLSLIAENRPPEFLSIKHVGMITGGVEDTESEEVQKWAPSFENYSFSDAGSSTAVHVALETTPEFEEPMAAMWPKALACLKALCEAGSGS